MPARDTARVTVADSTRYVIEARAVALSRQRESPFNNKAKQQLARVLRLAPSARARGLAQPYQMELDQRGKNKQNSLERVFIVDESSFRCSTALGVSKLSLQFALQSLQLCPTAGRGRRIQQRCQRSKLGSRQLPPQPLRLTPTS